MAEFRDYNPNDDAKRIRSGDVVAIGASKGGAEFKFFKPTDELDASWFTPELPPTDRRAICPVHRFIAGMCRMKNPVIIVHTSDLPRFEALRNPLGRMAGLLVEGSDHVEPGSMTAVDRGGSDAAPAVEETP